MARRFLKVEDVLRRMQDLSEEESGPEEDMHDEINEQDNMERNENDEEEEFYHNVGIDYEAEEESGDDSSSDGDAVAQSTRITARDGTDWIQQTSNVRRGPRRSLNVFCGISRPSATSQRVIMDQECPADSLKLFLDRQMLLRIQVSFHKHIYEANTCFYEVLL